MWRNLKHWIATLDNARILLFPQFTDVSGSKLGNLGKTGGKIGIAGLREKSLGDGCPSGRVPKIRRRLV